VKHAQPGAISNSTAHVFERRPHQRHQTETPPMVRLISNLANDKAQPKIARTTFVQADCGAKSMPLAIFASARAWRSHNGSSHICNASGTCATSPVETIPGPRQLFGAAFDDVKLGV
jgi:hypothetical protein